MPKAIDQPQAQIPDAGDSGIGNFDLGDSAAQTLSLEFSEPPNDAASAESTLASVNGQPAGDSVNDVGDNPFLEMGDAFSQVGLEETSRGLGEFQSEAIGGKHAATVADAGSGGLDKSADKGADSNDAGDEKQDWNKASAFGFAVADMSKGPGEAARTEADDRFFAAVSGENSLNQQAAMESSNHHYVLDENSWNVQNNNNGIA